MLVTKNRKLEIALRRAKKYREDAEYRERCLERTRRWKEAHRDPDKPRRRKMTLEEKRQYLKEYHKRPEVRMRRSRYMHELYHNNPEYREKVKKYNRERYHRIKEANEKNS